MPYLAVRKYLQQQQQQQKLPQANIIYLKCCLKWNITSSTLPSSCIWSVWQTLEITLPRPYKAFPFPPSKVKSSAGVAASAQVFLQGKEGKLGAFLTRADSCHLCKPLCLALCKFFSQASLLLSGLDLLPISDIKRCRACRLHGR